MHITVLIGIDHLIVISFYRTVAETFDGHLHVRLSGTYPYLTDEYVMKYQLVTVVKGDGIAVV